MKSNKLIISAALTGAMTKKELCPNLPTTPRAIAEDVVSCAKAGAAIVHIHVRNEEQQFTMETSYFEDAMAEIKKACLAENVDVIINLTTSNGPGTDEIRIAHLKKLLPEMCSYNAGTLNWGTAVFENSPAFLDKLGLAVQELDIKPEVEIFDASMIGNAKRLIKRGILKEPVHFQFVLGIDGGLEGTIESVDYLSRKIPEGSTWSITGIGKTHMTCMLAGLAAGCDGLRVGLEDNIYFSHGVKATNVMLVQRAKELTELAGREVATAEEAREILGIKRRSF